MRGWARLWILLAAGGAATGPIQAQTRATIYSDGRIFVRRVIEVPLVRGRNLVTLPLEAVTPGSAALSDARS